ncbi:MAG: winged helix-turn-helix transcriptional regulator [Candidatus Omnitrophica bacterium]|nr:winged helix-turn-helix transcriptional regulator [Candidatus Omnitrophota bacterium]
MHELSFVFKALSQPLRLKIVRLLMDRGREAYGDELAKSLRIPAYQLSRHLKVLKAVGLVHERRAGRWVYYSLGDNNGHLASVMRDLIARAQMVGRPIQEPGPEARSDTPAPRLGRRPSASVEKRVVNINFAERNLFKDKNLA